MYPSGKRTRIKWDRTGNLMLPSEPTLPVLTDLFLAHTVQNLRNFLLNTTLTLRLVFKILQHLVARDGKPSTSGDILGHVKHDLFLRGQCESHGVLGFIKSCRWVKVGLGSEVFRGRREKILDDGFFRHFGERRWLPVRSAGGFTKDSCYARREIRACTILRNADQ